MGTQFPDRSQISETQSSISIVLLYYALSVLCLVYYDIESMLVITHPVCSVTMFGDT